MNKLFIAILVLGLPLAALADETECTFPVDMVKQVPPPNAAAVAAYQWNTRPFTASGSYQRELHIFYKNGDYAVIQHEYCKTYSFDVIYFRSKQLADLDAASIAKIVAGHFTPYNAVPVTFAKPLQQALFTALKPRHFKTEKDFSDELAGEVHVIVPEIYNEFSLYYQTLGQSNSIYSSVIAFDMILGIEYF